MSTNPLDSAVSSTGGSSFGQTLAEVRDFCERMNTMEGGFARSVWYYAITQKDDLSRYEAARIDGLDAEEVRKAARGIFPAYAGWSDVNMRKHVGLVKYRLQMGMSEPSFQSIAARWPKEPAQSKRQADIGPKIEEQIA